MIKLRLTVKNNAKLALRVQPILFYVFLSGTQSVKTGICKKVIPITHSLKVSSLLSLLYVKAYADTT